MGGWEVPTWASTQEDLARFTRRAALRAEGMQGAEPSNLPAQAGSSTPGLCVLGKLPSLSAPQFAPQQNGSAGRAPSELQGAGPAVPTGSGAHSRRCINAAGKCCGRGERVKAGRFLIVK